MKPVDQTILAGVEGDRKGDCFRACLASVLELAIEDVPHFMELPGDWFDHFDGWLADRDLFCLEIKLTEPKAVAVFSYGLPCILSGPGPRGVMHSVVGRFDLWGEGNREPRFYLEHDPHPSRQFLGGADPEWALFIGKRIS